MQENLAVLAFAATEAAASMVAATTAVAAASAVVTPSAVAAASPAVACVDSLPALRAALRQAQWDVLLAVEAPGANSAGHAAAAEAIAEAKAAGLPVIVLAAASDLPAAAAALEAGADDVVLPEHRSRLPLALRQAARAAQRARQRDQEAAALHAQTRQRLDRLSALHAIDIAITTSFDLRVTLSVFLDHVASQLAVDGAAVLLLNTASQMLEYAAVRGLSSLLLRQPPLRLADSLPGQVVLKRQVVQADNLSERRYGGLRHPPIADVFTGYYGVPLTAKGRVQGVLEVFTRQAVPREPDWLEYLKALATQAAIAIDNANLFNELQRSNMELNLAYDATIEGWARVLEARGLESVGHTRRVADHVLDLARRVGFGESELVHVRRGALLHDIGLLSVPEAVLLHDRPLTDSERAEMQRHPEHGFNILAPIHYLRPALDIPYCHHERWDGSGYPRGLAGEHIPLSARLFALVDVWDALRSDRPYRRAWPPGQAEAYIREQSGRLFDPRLVDLFLRDAKM